MRAGRPRSRQGGQRHYKRCDAGGRRRGCSGGRRCRHGRRGGRRCGRRSRCRQQTRQRRSLGQQGSEASGQRRQQVLRCGGGRGRCIHRGSSRQRRRRLRKGDRRRRGRRRCGRCSGRGSLHAAEHRRQALHELGCGGGIGCELLEERQAGHARCRCGCRRLGCGRRAKPQRNRNRTRGSDHAGGKRFSSEFHGFSNPLKARCARQSSCYCCSSSDTCGSYSTVTNAKAYGDRR
jgi:hypothetical protein